jgi:hypothetical protein
MNQKILSTICGALLGAVIGLAEGIREASGPDGIDWFIVPNIALFGVWFGAFLGLCAGLLYGFLRRSK